MKLYPLIQATKPQSGSRDRHCNRSLRRPQLHDLRGGRRLGGLGAVRRRNRLPPPLGGGGHQAAKQMEEEGKRKAVISLDGRSPLYVAQGVANGVGVGPDSICRCLPSVYVHALLRNELYILHAGLPTEAVNKQKAGQN